MDIFHQIDPIDTICPVDPTDLIVEFSLGVKDLG